MAKIETDISVGKARVAVETVLVSLFRGLSWTLTLKGTQLYDSELVSDMLQVQRPVSSFFKSLTSMTHASSSFRYILPTPFLPFLHWWAPLFHFVLQDFPLLSWVNSHEYHSRSGRHESFIVSPSIIDTIASFGSYSLILKAREVANKTRRMDFILSRTSSLTLKSLIVHRNIFVLSSCNGKRYKLSLICVLNKKIKTLSFGIKIIFISHVFRHVCLGWICWLFYTRKYRIHVCEGLDHALPCVYQAMFSVGIFCCNLVMGTCSLDYVLVWHAVFVWPYFRSESRNKND